jgi:3-oxoacyl-[acyl-carrier protein] reductase
VPPVDLGIDGRLAVVTGASRGIGSRIAVDLAREGCDIVLCARDPDALATVAAEVEAAGGHALVVPCDLTAPDAGEVVRDAALGFRSRIDIVVNNAGGNTPGKLEALTDLAWREGFELNFFAAVRMTYACLPTMRAQRWGRVISIASIYGRQPDPQFGPYSAAKAALINFTTNLSRAFSAEGVLANSVVPGVTMTELVERNAAAAADAMSTSTEDIMAKMMAKTPVSMGRFGQPDEVAAAVVFLASARASWITGSCLTVDGGTIRVAP